MFDVLSILLRAPHAGCFASVFVDESSPHTKREDLTIMQSCGIDMRFARADML